MIGGYEVVYWHWLILGLVMLILEALAPAAFFLWLGIAALIVGLLHALIPGLQLEWQLILFSLLSVASIVAWRQYRRGNPATSDQPTLNKRGHNYIGRVFTLEQAIENGAGKIRVDDSSWKIRGEDQPAGSKVRVQGVDGTILLVADAGGEHAD